ncbi:MAG: hypothetical protein ACI8T1_000847 [Verrucomicrobiales bacterium]
MDGLVKKGYIDKDAKVPPKDFPLPFGGWSLLKHLFFLGYATVAYVLALANIAYLVGFIAGIGVPKGINDGPVGSLWHALIVDISLVFLFGLHHSITARRSFKAWWTQFIPSEIERATYLYMTAAISAFMILFWRPIPITLWHFDHPLAANVILAVYLAVWVLMLGATFHFGHFSFLGLRQAWDRLRRQPPARARFTARYLYALVRHPISLGWMLAPWVTPHMTVGLATFAISTAIYILVATYFEERDLIEEFGEHYQDYRKKVPPFVPGVHSRGSNDR